MENQLLSDICFLLGLTYQKFKNKNKLNSYELPSDIEPSIADFLFDLQIWIKEFDFFRLEPLVSIKQCSHFIPDATVSFYRLSCSRADAGDLARY